MAGVDGSVYQTTEEYLAIIIERLQQAGSKITDFNAGSRARSLFEGYAAAASQHSAVLEQLRQDSYLATATGDALDRKAADYQVTRIAAVAAAGTVTMSRPAAGAAITVPAGWGQLLTQPQVGQQPVAVVTTADASFDAATLTVTVPAVAVTPGTAGNLASGTQLLPSNPVNGFDTLTAFSVAAAFTGGVDQESDDALRARVPVEVAGRVKGRPEALQAAAIRIPGVTSANVLEAGTTIAGGPDTVPGGQVRVYFAGDPGLLGQVQAAEELARVASQDVEAFPADDIEVVFACTVYCLPGIDTAGLQAAVDAAVTATVAAVPVGGTLYASALAQAIHALADVISVTLPFTQLRRSFEVPGTSHDIVLGNTQAASVGTLTVTVETLS